MNVPVTPLVRKHFFNGSNAELIYLSPESGSSRMWTLEMLAAEIEETSSLSKGDVVHTTGILMTELRKVLIKGDRVKIPDLGIFYMTISCKGVATKEELNVRNIEAVNIRFRPDKALKLVNNALAPTRSDNNVAFAIKEAKVATSDSTDGGTDPDDGGGEYIDPNA